MDPFPNNTRYILELERKALLQEKNAADAKYGTFSFAFLASLEALALFAYLYIAIVLIYYKKIRTKTNFVVSVWAAINFAVLTEKLSREFSGLVHDDDAVISDATHLMEMIAALGRSYGTLLSVLWLFSKYFDATILNNNIFLYFLIPLPAILCSFYVYYYFAINPFIFEVYGPGCDVIHAIVYMMVALVYFLCKIFIKANSETPAYALIISVISLVTNFPICLMRIYLRFNLDIDWTYWLHTRFIDSFLDAFQCSAAFSVLLVVILYHKSLLQKEIKIDPAAEQFTV